MRLWQGLNYIVRSHSGSTLTAKAYNILSNPVRTDLPLGQAIVIVTAPAAGDTLSARVLERIVVPQGSEDGAVAGGAFPAAGY